MTCPCIACPCRERVLALEALVRELRAAIRLAEPDLEEGVDAFRAFVRATDGALCASLKHVPE